MVFSSVVCVGEVGERAAGEEEVVGRGGGDAWPAGVEGHGESGRGVGGGENNLEYELKFAVGGLRAHGQPERMDRAGREHNGKERREIEGRLIEVVAARGERVVLRFASQPVEVGNVAQRCVVGDDARQAGLIGAIEIEPLDAVSAENEFAGGVGAKHLGGGGNVTDPLGEVQLR